MNIHYRPSSSHCLSNTQEVTSPYSCVDNSRLQIVNDNVYMYHESSIAINLDNYSLRQGACRTGTILANGRNDF